MESIFIEFKAVDKRGEKPYVFNKNNINYFRPYFTGDSSTQTAIYLKGSDKPVIVPITHEAVKRKLMRVSEIAEALYLLGEEETERIFTQIKENNSKLLQD